MKIVHKSKRVAPAHPQVADAISKLLNTLNEELPEVLAQIDVWKWPRSDLNVWVKILNKFDAILEEVIKEYEIDKLQLKVFTPLTKRTVCEILRFERLLLENSTNRKMFNSYDRLNSLLFTADLDVLVLSLNLLLRPSQQYSAQPAVSQALNISTPRLQSLAKRWPNLRDYGIGLVELVGAKGTADAAALPTEAREVNYNFYASQDQSLEKDKDNMDTDVSDASPRKPIPTAPSGPSSSRHVSVHIEEQVLTSKQPMESLAEAIDVFDIPDTEKFECLCRIRSAWVLGAGKEADREKLVIIRLLAIAIFGHTHSEAQATSSMFLYEPDLIVHIAELLQLDHGIPVAVQTAAIAALDALARYRNKIHEVLTAVNAGVNHGILMALVRKTVTEVADPASNLPHSFVEALLSFVTFLATHAAGGNMVVGAGLVPLLIQVIENRLPNRLAVVSKTMQLVDNVLYSFTNAFQLFAGARGVEVLVDRIEYEIDLNINVYAYDQRSLEAFGSHSDLPVARAAVLKHILRSMHRMMQSPGTAEGLRGLIDTSILKSIKKVIECRGLFGPSILHIAINIMSTFVHNEPTSLAIIQEAGLPETFYRAVESGVEPSIEIIQSIPNAIGALCLNPLGQDQLAARPSIIPGIFSVFTSERHLKVLQDKENAVLIGTAIDELIRHHPTLRTSVFDSLLSTLTKIEDLGWAYEASEDVQHWYHLLPVSSVPGDHDVAMGDVEPDIGEAKPTATPDNEFNDNIRGSSSDDAPRTHDNLIVSFIDVLGRFLEGLFQHPQHCKDFLSQTDGLQRIGRITALPCLPYDFANSVASDSLVQVMRTMTDASASQTLPYLMRLVRSSLGDTKDFWETVLEESKLFPLVDLKDDKELEKNQRFRSLVTLHIRTTLLSDVFATAGYAHGRAAATLLQALNGSGVSGIMSELGSLHRASIWENIVLTKELVSRGIDVSATPATSPLERSPDRGMALPEADGSTPNGVVPESSSAGIESNTPTRKDRRKPESPREQNAKAIKHLTHGLPNSLAPFFQATVKMFYARRNPDVHQKKHIFETAEAIALIMLQHLTVKDLGTEILSRYAYYTLMLGLITLLLIDERTSQSTIHTVLLSAFHRLGGLDTTFNICRQFTATIESLYNVKLDDRSEDVAKELVHAYGGLKVALHLIHPLIMSKPLFESGQTLLAASRDKQDTDPEFFEPHNFLVKLRFTTLPLMRELWESPWLVSAPLAMCRPVVQVVMELIGADNEEPKESADTSLAHNFARESSTVVVPDENCVTQLTEMGFLRSAAERALIRTRNNVNNATELLLSHPFPFPPPPELIDDISGDEVIAASGVSDDDDALPSGSNSEPLEPPEPLVPPPDVGSSTDTESGEGRKGVQGWRAALSEAREPLKSVVAFRALLLVDEHPSLIFDLHTAFVRPVDEYQKQAVLSLVEDVRAFTPSAYDSQQQQQLANRFRLLALVLKETPSSLSEDARSDLMDRLLALLASNLAGGNDGPVVAKWLAAHLLVTEFLLTIGEQLKPVTLPKEDESIPDLDLSLISAFPHARAVVFDFCLRLLKIPELPSDESLSVLRLIVLVTRSNQFARQFVQRDGIQLLFTRLKAPAISAGYSYVAIILRHVVEDPIVLRNIMQLSVKRYFTQPRTRAIDMNTYVRNCSMIALRDPGIFIDVTKSLCELSGPFVPSHQIRLKSTAVGTDQSAQQSEGTTQAKMQVDASQTKSEPTSMNESSELLIHSLISELMKTVRPTTDKQAEGLSNDFHGQFTSDQASNIASESNGDEVAQDRFAYSCLLMQMLTELLFSYESCKSAFLSYSSKKRQTPSKETSPKHRTAALQFFLSELVAFESLNPDPTPEARNRLTLVNHAMSVVLALCVDPSAMSEMKDVSSDLVSVRKFVLEAISRAIKDTSSSESVDARYGRLLALSELCYRMLMARFSGVSRKTPQDDVPTHIAKVMLEKNFVSIITNALAEVDLNYPNVKTLLASLLKPLEYLSKVAIKMSRASNKIKDFDDTRTDSMSSRSSEDDDQMDENDQRETPDLYRNSALGMYGGEMEDVQAEIDEEEEEDDEDDVEMDFGDGTGSEDTSDTEEEAAENDIENENRDSDEMWQDEDEEDEENLVENEENEEEDEEHEDDQEDDGGIIWQGIVDTSNVNPGTQEEADEDEAEVQIPIVRTDSEIEPDAQSEEDLVHDLGIIDVPPGTQPAPEDIFGLAATFSNGLVDNGPRDTGGFFVPPFLSRRQHSTSDNNMRLWGRPRNGSTPPAETTTHPLLLDTNSSSNRGSTNQSRTSRRPQRAVMGGDAADLLQTIEDLLGDAGAVQLIHHFMSHGVGVSEAIRVDVPARALLDLHRRLGNAFSTTVRTERPVRSGEVRAEGREFEPLFTLQRWFEEVKILHGEFIEERSNAVTNYIIVTLLPAAIEAAKRKKLIEEEELAKEKELRAKQEAESNEKKEVQEGLHTDAETSTQVEVPAASGTDEAGITADRPDESPRIQESTNVASDPDTEMVDASASAVSDPAASDPAAQAATADTEQAAVPSTSDQNAQPTERITVSIHGAMVDITDTGIDPTFLEALPDDMREEVLNQHARDQRAARVERPPDSQISAEFLDALPPEIRAEIIQQERQEQARREQMTGAAEIDPASFIASLDPQLREVVLLDQDDGFIQTLPSHMIAEAGAYRESSQAQRQHHDRSTSRSLPPRPVPRKIPSTHDAIQLLDKTGVAVLVRLLFFPQVLKKSLLFKLLLNLCENSKTRTELSNLLLSILQDGTGDLAAVDKSFSQMSVRSSKFAAQTPKATGKQKANPEYLTTLQLPNLQHDAAPEVIAQRCLEALAYIVGSNELSSLFFLTEHELPAGLRRAASKKGKGKERQVPQTHYPIVLLLGLLDRQSLVKTPSIMEAVVSLLATVTKPLTSMANPSVKEQSSPESSSVPPVIPASPPPPETNVASPTVPPTVPATSPPVGTLGQQTSEQSPPSPPISPDVVTISDRTRTIAQQEAQPSVPANEAALLAKPPQIPHTALRLIVNILTTGECSGRTFQQSLALIQHLSYIPDARDVIASELKSKAQEFGQVLYSDLEELVGALQSSSGISSVASKFSAPSSEQAKLLRVLKTIDYMYSAKASTESAHNATDTEKVQRIYESFRFTPLWQRLGDCLAIIEQKPAMEHIATVLLPLIEALMVVCKYVAPKSAVANRALRASVVPRSPILTQESMEELFVTFTDAHRKVLNLMVRNNPSLMSGSFSLLVHNPRVLDFDNKRNYFTQQLHRRPHSRDHHTTLQLNVRRARVFEDSFQHLQRKTGEQIKYGKLSVRFYDEEGVDAGGVTREWFQILARQMFDPNNALFQPCAADRLTYQPNKNSWVNPEHLSFFKFVGRVIGKAIYDGRLLDAYFARSLYRQILGKPVDYRDVEWVDPEYYNSLCWILENDPSPLDLNFSVEADEFGANRIIELKEGGVSIPVTQENKKEFVQLSARYRLYSSIKDQIESLLGGFYEIIPKDLITIFNEQELELLISGTPDIDVDEWRAATEYNGYTSSDPVIVWWWRALKSFNREERAKVLSFATGTSRVPLNGFVDLQGVQGVQRFSIHRAYGDPNRLPQAHTCFNQIDLPQYTSYEMLRQQLLLAIEEGSEGFGFA